MMESFQEFVSFYLKMLGILLGGFILMFVGIGLVAVNGILGLIVIGFSFIIMAYPVYRIKMAKREQLVTFNSRNQRF